MGDEQLEPLFSGHHSIPFSPPCTVAAASPATSTTATVAASTRLSDTSASTAGELPLAGSHSTEPLLRPDTHALLVPPDISANTAGGWRAEEDTERLRRRNVSLSLAFTALNTLYLACAQGPVFDMYIFILGNKGNRWVGETESLSGLVALVVAVPVGIFVDKYSRSKICKVTCILGVIAAAASLWGVIRDSFACILVSLAFWGLFWEASNSATNALFTDSLSRGDRTKWFTWKGMVRNAAWAVAPLLMIGFFAAYGDDWDLSHVRLLIICGTFVFAPTCSLLLWFFADVIRGVTERVTSASSNAAAATIPSSTTSDNIAGPPVVDPFPGSGTLTESDDHLSRLTRLQRSVPFIISLSDFVRSMGAGMTVKFFPLFFSNEYHLAPIQLCELGVLYALSIVVFIYVAGKLATCLGRALASQLLSFVGLCMLGSMCFVTDLRFLVLAHLIRGGTQNANYPLDRSILMDFTKSKDRGKWSAVETFTSTMWSGSAFLGGILADNGYRYAFGVTAIVYTVAWVIYIPLVFIVPEAESVIGIRQGSPSVAPVSPEPPVTARAARDAEPAEQAPNTAETTGGTSGTDCIDMTPFSEEEEWDLEGSPDSSYSTTTPGVSTRELPAGPRIPICNDVVRGRATSGRLGAGPRSRKGKKEPERGCLPTP